MIGLFLGRSSAKIAQIFLPCCTKWPPELKIEKKNPSNNIFFVTTGQISTKLDRIVLRVVLYQNCSNCTSLLHKMATRAKNSNNFSNVSSITTWRISTKLGLFLGRSSPKLLNGSAPLHNMKARAKNRKIQMTSPP